MTPAREPGQGLELQLCSFEALADIDTTPVRRKRMITAGGNTANLPNIPP